MLKNPMYFCNVNICFLCSVAYLNAAQSNLAYLVEDAAVGSSSLTGK